MPSPPWLLGSLDGAKAPHSKAEGATTAAPGSSVVQPHSSPFQQASPDAFTLWREGKQGATASAPGGAKLPLPVTDGVRLRCCCTGTRAGCACAGIMGQWIQSALVQSVWDNKFGRACKDGFKLLSCTCAQLYEKLVCHVYELESGPNRLEGIVEEKTNSICSEGPAAGKSEWSVKAVRSATASSSGEAKAEFFEVSIHPLLPGPG
eukprot:scaffold94597_cov20-Tisochrysis_lutea.AAC.1